MIHVLIRGRNCEKYIHKCLQSLSLQTRPWCALVLLDSPSDNSYRVSKDAVTELALDGVVKIIKTKRRYGLGFNMFNGIDWIAVNWIPNPEDVIAIVDADDTIEPRAFNIVEAEYLKHPNCLVTHGSYIKKSKNRKTKISRPYPNRVDFRKHPWRGSHLKTFKFKLWEHMRPEYFGHNGEMAGAASDLALMLPLMELAGRDRVRHIKDPIYIWRDNYRGSTNSTLQKKWDKIIRNKPALNRLDDNQLRNGGEWIG